MFPNLEAEQARNRHTNEYVAGVLSLSRQSYQAKKKTGNFRLREIKKLAEMYNATCDYLFADAHEGGQQTAGLHATTFN